MSNENKTHYRKAFNSPYLSSADIVEPTILTIKHVRLEKDLTKKTKDFFNTAYFVEDHIRDGEKLKPMILNATNSRTVKCLVNSPFIDDWSNIPVTVYVDSKVRMMGEYVDGLRISLEKPRLTKPELVPDNVNAWARAIDACKRDGHLGAVLEHMVISDDHQKMIMEQSKNVG